MSCTVVSAHTVDARERRCLPVEVPCARTTSVRGVSLRPVRGSNRAIVGEVRAWLAASSEPEPLIIETSGSTGSPKHVVLSRAAMLASATATTKRLGAEGVWLLALPVSYVAGLQVVVRSLAAGHEPVVVAEHASFAAAYDAAPDVPRFTSLVSAQLPRLLDDKADSAVLRRCHTVLLGGGPIDPVLRRRTEDLGVTVVATYGSSETAGGCVYDGVPLDGVRVAVADDGRIQIAGPTLFSGYHRDPELTAATLVNGWFGTSDRGEFDDSGRLRVLGRVDDVVITGGVNVSVSQVTARLREHPMVADVAVVGVPDERWGQRVVAAVVSGGGPTLAQLRDFVSETLPREWAPRQLLVLDRLPMLPNGKLDRLALVVLATGSA
jgi:o-succinylbenzoate---CoA ligase